MCDKSQAEKSFDSQLGLNDQELLMTHYKGVLKTFFNKMQIAFVIFFLVACLLMGILFAKVDRVVTALQTNESQNITAIEAATASQTKVLQRLQSISDRQQNFNNRPDNKPIQIKVPFIVNRVVKVPSSHSS